MDKKISETKNDGELVMQENDDVSRDFSFDDAEVMEFQKRKLSEIIKEKDEVDPEKVAEEILNWLTENVTTFIDNHQKKFIINIVVADEDQEDSVKMPHSRKLQNLFRAIPEPNVVMDESGENEEQQEENNEFSDLIDESSPSEVRAELHQIVEEAFEKMKSKEELLDKLFSAMIYFYELQGIYQGEYLTKSLVGEVAINYFSFEAFSVGVSLQDKETQEVMKKYIIPESFAIDIEIAYREKTPSTSIF